jgi:TIR domain
MNWNEIAVVGAFAGAVGAVVSTGISIRQSREDRGPVEAVKKAGAPGQAGLEREFDVFLSYAREDSATLASELATELRANKLNVLMDEERPGPAEHLSSVADAAAASQYALIILSPKLLANVQARNELETLARTKGGGSPTILQVLSGLDMSDVRAIAPELKNKFRVNADELTPHDLAQQITGIVSAADARYMTKGDSKTS